MPKKTLTKTGINTRIATQSAIVTAIFVILAIGIGLGYSFIVRHSGKNNYDNANKFFQEYIK